MDRLKVIKDFESLRPLMADPKLKTSVKLLCVFGFNGTEVIIVTKEDLVYGFGRNRLGCLGLGVLDTDIPTPRLNTHMSGKGLHILRYGFSHTVGVTSSGQCWSWGQNDFGQLGTGSFVANPTPHLIAKLVNQFVVDVSCGNRHTMALTSDGQVYAWGRNTFGQLGDGTWCWRQYPTPISISEPMAAISCGKNHSLGLTKTGLVYVWGLNDFGQLGRPKDHDIRHFSDGQEKERAFNENPGLIAGFETKKFQKALCGPNHTVLLSTSGHIYAFGLNEYGEVGNGSFDTQFTPIKICPNIQFQDIITCFESTLTMGIDSDGKRYVWGHTYHQEKVAKPFDITKWTHGHTLVDIYARYSGFKKPHKVIDFNDLNINSIDITKTGSPSARPKTLNSNPSVEVLPLLSQRSSSISLPEDQSDETMAGLVFQRHLAEAFDSQSDFDLVFVFENEVIYCHKTILQIRNKLFAKLIEKYLVNDREIHMGEHYSYETVYAFIQFVYSMAPEVNPKNCEQLLELANTFSELNLKKLCSKYLQSTIDTLNVCVIYEMSINYKLKSLEKYCLDFGSNNWKAVCTSPAIQSMDETVSQQFISLIISEQN